MGATTTMIIGADVGYKETKLVWLDEKGHLRFVAMPSVASTNATAVDFDGSQQGAYRINSQRWTVGVSAQDTQSDTFHSSDQARALLHHALREAGMKGQTVKIASCVPMSIRYNLDATTSTECTRVIKENVTGACEWLGTNHGMTVEGGGVLAEGYAAWLHNMFGFNGQFQKDNKLDGLVIDIGGHTLDISRCRGTRLLYKESASFRDCGVYYATKELNSILQHKYGYSFGQATLDSVLQTGVLKMFDEPLDVSREVESVLERTAQHIKNQILTKIHNLYEIPEILLVGGGAALFGKYLQEDWKNLKVDEQPTLANALGCLKVQMMEDGVKKPLAAENPAAVKVEEEKNIEEPIEATEEA